MYLRNFDKLPDSETANRQLRQEETYGHTRSTWGNNSGDDVTWANNGPKGAFNMDYRYKGKSSRSNNCAETDEPIYDDNSWYEVDCHDDQWGPTQVQVDLAGRETSRDLELPEIESYYAAPFRGARLTAGVNVSTPKIDVY